MNLDIFYITIVIIIIIIIITYCDHLFLCVCMYVCMDVCVYVCVCQLRGSANFVIDYWVRIQ
jgi:hypothetical protein